MTPMNVESLSLRVTVVSCTRGAKIVGGTHRNTTPSMKYSGIRSNVGELITMDANAAITNELSTICDAI